MVQYIQRNCQWFLQNTQQELNKCDHSQKEKRFLTTLVTIAIRTAKILIREVNAEIKR